MKDENEKCGEIYRRGPGKFVFSCAYCTEIFDSKTNALTHIEKHFTFEAATTGTTAKQFNLQTTTESGNFFSTLKNIKIPEDSENTFKDNFIQTPSKDIETVTCKVEFEDSHSDTEFMPPNDDENYTSDSLSLKLTKPEVSPATKSQETLEWGPLNKAISRVQCDYCKNKFQKCHIRRHMMNTHINPKASTCSVCKAVFLEKKKFYLHMRKHEVRKISCHICGAQHASNSALYCHMRVHTGEKPFECEVCKRKFAQKNGLVVHIRMHTGEKPFKCDICDRRFSDSSTCKLHKRRHTNDRRYQCELCGKPFMNSHGLKKHRVVHTGETPFTCEICKRKFGLSSRLQNHMRTHTGEKPFKCRYCDAHFAHYSGRIQHEKAYHSLQLNSAL